MKAFIILPILIALSLCNEPFQEIFRWNSIEVSWPSEEERLQAINRGGYIPANNPIAGIKLWKDKMYLTIPRWKDGVPVTLGVTSAVPVNDMTAPVLEAFPNWAMQKIGDCNAFQLVEGIEIDPQGRMWVLDNGRTSLSIPDMKYTCPLRLVILDLEKNGEILRTYEFPSHVAKPGSSYLNDVVLDHEDGGMAYITDNSREDPGIIVYSLRNNTSWKIRHESMRAKQEAVEFMVARSHVIEAVNIDGIALSPANSTDRMVYYCPLSSFHLYALPTSVLRNNTANVDPYVQELGRKNSQSGGMAMSSTGVLYFGLLADDAVAMWDTKHVTSFTTGQRVISRDHGLMQWPHSFAFDENGNFWCVTNSLQNFLNNRVNISVPNYRVIRTRVGSKNYQYYENGMPPELPVITSGTGKIRAALATALAIVFTLTLM